MSSLLRGAIAVGIGGVTLALGLMGASEALLKRAVVAGLRLWGFAPVHDVDRFLFVAGPHLYRVDFWCTPTILTLCLCFLLWFGGQRPLAYALTAVSAVLLANVLMAGNILLSIFLQIRFHLGWPWAHRPGLVAVYAACLGACVLFVSRLRPAAPG